MLLQESIPTDVTRALRVMMVNKLCVDSFDLGDGLDDSHWSVEVFSLHRITAPRDNPIGSVVGMSTDQVNQHDLSVECDGEQGKELHDKLRFVLLDVVVEDDHQDLGCCLLALKHYLELIGVVCKPQVAWRIRIFAFVIKEHIGAVAGKVSNNKVQNHQVGVKIIGRWPRMPRMRHGEAATEILNLNLNRGHCGHGCHVDVTSIMSTVVVVTIGDDSTRNRLIRSVLLDELLDKS